MTPLNLEKIRESVQLAAWEAWIAGVPMSWIAA